MPTHRVGKIVVDLRCYMCLDYVSKVQRPLAMTEALLRDITEYCRGARMAESTFGRLAVNDGKLVSRLRLGGRVTTDTAERVRAFIAREPDHPINGVPVAAPLSLPSPAAAHNF